MSSPPTPLPVSTSTDPRLQPQPKHTLGPWPISRNVSSSSSTYTSAGGVRSRASTGPSCYNGMSASHSPTDGSAPSPVEEIHEMREMTRVTTRGNKVHAEGIETHDNVDGAHPSTNEDTQTSESNIDTTANTEAALKRDIFSIHPALTHGPSSPSLPLSSNSNPSLPTIQPTHSITTATSSTFTLPRSAPGHTLHGSVHSSSTDGTTISLILRPPASNLNASTYSFASSPTSAFAHLQPGDPITLQTCPPITLQTRPPIPAPNTPTHIHLRPLAPSHHPKPRHRPLPHRLTSALLPPPAGHPLPHQTDGYPNFIFMSFLYANAFTFGASLFLAGRWAVGDCRARGVRKGRKRGGERNKEGKERRSVDLDTRDIGNGLDKDEEEEAKEGVAREEMAMREDTDSIYTDLESHLNSDSELLKAQPNVPGVFAIAFVTGMLCLSWTLAWGTRLVEDAEVQL